MCFNLYNRFAIPYNIRLWRTQRKGNFYTIKFIVLLVILLSGMVFNAKSARAEMAPKEILQKADASRGNVEGVEWEIMIESNEKGRKQERTLKIMARDFNSLAEFISPPKVKGQKLLMIDRNMWFVKPGLRKPVPISPRQKLIGGASNGDIASTNYAGDYEATHMSNEKVNVESCYFFDLRATNKNATYDRIKYWVSEQRLVGVKAEFFTVSGKMFKSATFEYNNRIMVQDEPRSFVSKMVITNAVIKEDITTMTYSKVKIKRIPDSTFNLNLLVR
ncbi:MAG: outer membrane lipoprotein-sorting protein [Proteobacteria bacterium]|nr:outer membrane lipoprotein-sorting protein [Pseudomonadota bacterium]